MRRLFKRLIIISMVVAGGAVVLRTLRRRASPSPPTVGPSAEWPPFERQAEPVKAGAIGDVATAAELAVDELTDRDWMPPTADGCPDGYPIKANDNSHIYHSPGGRFYDRTVAERCYVSAEAAERDGYRQSKA
jgi:hypothetical protein